jgi:hypothetical protein
LSSKYEFAENQSMSLFIAANFLFKLALLKYFFAKRVSPEIMRQMYVFCEENIFLRAFLFYKMYFCKFDFEKNDVLIKNSKYFAYKVFKSVSDRNKNKKIEGLVTLIFVCS